MELVSLARNPIPSGAVAGTFAGYDGAALRFAHWAATRGPRRGTVCIFPGHAEFIEKYFETIADLRRRGFAVAILDWRGQGGSFRPVGDPRKGHIDDFSEYDRDLVCFMREIVLPDCPPPYTVMGHSMGGHIALRNLTTLGSWFDRAVLLAPMIQLHPHILGYPERWVALYARLMCLAGFRTRYVLGGRPDKTESTKFADNLLTSDRERYQRNRMLEEAAPELLIGSPTVGWLDAAIRSMAYVNTVEFAEQVRIPALIFTPGRDRIVRPRSIENFAARLKSGTGVRLSQAQHELLQENDEIRARFWAAFDAYLGVADVSDQKVA
ncbi:MAG: alpha/beta hydrolase [Hyphomicrobiaceae bacterium]|nr:alpha/beta hydrolase [Hyphomicrobiaceae bacterium]